MKKKLTTFDLFYAVVLKIIGNKPSIVKVEGMKPKGLVSFSNDKGLPALSDFEVTCKGEKISTLENFIQHYFKFKGEIFRLIDKDGEKANE